MEASSKFAGCLEWRANDDRYFYDEDGEQFVLTDEAPPEARRSFARWQKLVAAHNRT